MILTWLWLFEMYFSLSNFIRREIWVPVISLKFHLYHRIVLYFLLLCSFIIVHDRVYMENYFLNYIFKLGNFILLSRGNNTGLEAYNIGLQNSDTRHHHNNVLWLWTRGLPQSLHPQNCTTCLEGLQQELNNYTYMHTHKTMHIHTYTHKFIYMVTKCLPWSTHPLNFLCFSAPKFWAMLSHAKIKIEITCNR